MMANAHQPVVIGPFPPPVHGLSEVNRLVLASLMQFGKPIQINTAPNPHSRWLEPFYMLLSVARLVLELVLRPRRNVYISVSGGSRQLIDLLMILIARFTGSSVYLHHHTFRYLKKNSRLIQAIVAVAPRAVHIVLCECMEAVLRAKYRIRSEQVMVISNAAFLSISSLGPSETHSDGVLRVAYLSSITPEKGVIRFIDCIEALESSGVPVVASIAGPLSGNFEQEFFRHLGRCKSIKYEGPVYGKSKEEFLARHDLLLFPSELNEAEPLTIYEALAAGLCVIATERGCIASQLAESGGFTLANHGSFSQHAAVIAKSLFVNKAKLAELKSLGVSSFERHAARARSQAEVLVKMLGSSPRQGA